MTEFYLEGKLHYQLKDGRTVSDEVYRMNERVLGGKKVDQSELAKRIAKEKRKAHTDRNRQIFKLFWTAYKDVYELDEEHPFHPTRNWRFDLCHHDSKVAIELEGGTNSRHKKSRHTTPEGYKGDRKKYNAATELGWVVISLTTDMISAPDIQLIVNTIQRRLQERRHD